MQYRFHGGEKQFVVISGDVIPEYKFFIGNMQVRIENIFCFPDYTCFFLFGNGGKDRGMI